MTTRVTRSRGRVAAALAAALLAGLLTAWATRPAATAPSADAAPATAAAPAESTPYPSGPAPSSGSAGPLGTPAPATPLLGRPATGSSATDAAPPRALEIPRLDLEMPVGPVGIDEEGQMALPPTPFTVGWYRFGPAPGAGTGASVLAGHVDTPRDGAGPLVGLERLDPGDVVVVRSAEGELRYRVQSVRSVGKNVLDLDGLFARDGPERLHLVTCGGEFDRRTRQYADNVVVVALPEGRS